MTIHKSKGLEFPVCFVAGLDKKYNLKDTTDTILLDADWGVVANRVKPERRTTGQTMRKKTFMRKMKRDSIGEELRVLYVAMTRAKEKLILTGSVGGAPEFEKIRAELDAICEGVDGTVSADYVERCHSALEHIIGAYVRKPDCLKYSLISEEEIQRKQIKFVSGKLIREERIRMLGDVETDAWSEEESERMKYFLRFIRRRAYQNLNMPRLRRKRFRSYLKPRIRKKNIFLHL
jgi:ATP-dependent helicase/nuclease subunit A